MLDSQSEPENVIYVAAPSPLVTWVAAFLGAASAGLLVVACRWI